MGLFKKAQAVLRSFRGQKPCPVPGELAFRHPQEIFDTYQKLFLDSTLKFEPVECDCGRYHVQVRKDIDGTNTGTVRLAIRRSSRRETERRRAVHRLQD